MAAAAPDIDFIGVEVHKPGVGALLNGLLTQGLGNVRVYSCDALEVLRHCVADASLDRLLLFFPDPWHKKRHHKRRIVQPEFAELVRRKLKVGGVLHMATDWEPYAEHMLDVMSAAPGYRNQAEDGRFVPRPQERPVTKFERRGERLGHGVWDLVRACRLIHRTSDVPLAPNRRRDSKQTGNTRRTSPSSCTFPGFGRIHNKSGTARPAAKETAVLKKLGILLLGAGCAWAAQAR